MSKIESVRGRVHAESSDQRKSSSKNDVECFWHGEAIRGRAYPSDTKKHCSYQNDWPCSVARSFLRSAGGDRYFEKKKKKWLFENTQLFQDISRTEEYDARYDFMILR